MVALNPGSEETQVSISDCELGNNGGRSTSLLVNFRSNLRLEVVFLLDVNSLEVSSGAGK